MLWGAVAWGVAVGQEAGAQTSPPDNQVRHASWSQPTSGPALSIGGSNEAVVVGRSTQGTPLKWRAKQTKPVVAPSRLLEQFDARPLNSAANAEAAPDGHGPAVLPTQATLDAEALYPPADEIVAPAEALPPRLFSASQPAPQPGLETTPQLPEQERRAAPRTDLFDQLGQAPLDARLQVDCEAEYGNLRSITSISTKITPQTGDMPPECTLVPEDFQPRDWGCTTYTWKASGLCHKPLYFEETALERYGHSTGPLSQPIVSGAHFFATLPVLPYKMGMDPPWECVYPLGHYRPGSCAPYMIPPVPFSLRGAATQAAAVTGLIYIFP